MTVLVLATLAQLATTSPQTLDTGGLSTAWDDIPFPMFWTDYNEQGLRFEDTIVFFNGRRMKYCCSGDSLEMFKPISWFDTDDSEPQDETDNYSFVFTHRDTDSIVLRPYYSSRFKPRMHNRTEDYLFDTTSTFTLYNPFRLIDTSLSFNRILYRLQSVFQGEIEFSYIDGHKSSMVNPHNRRQEENDKWVMIDSTKHIYFYGSKFATRMASFDKYYDEHVLQQGYYQGVLDDSMYNSLIHLLMFCNPDRLHTRNDRSSGSTWTFEIYYGKAYKKFNCHSPSPFISAIIHQINELLMAVPLTRSNAAKKKLENFNKTQGR